MTTTHSADVSPSLAARVTRGLTRRHASEANPLLPGLTTEVLLRRRQYATRKCEVKRPLNKKCDTAFRKRKRGGFCYLWKLLSWSAVQENEISSSSTLSNSIEWETNYPRSSYRNFCSGSFLLLRSCNLAHTVAIYYLTVDTLFLHSGGYPPPSRLCLCF